MKRVHRATNAEFVRDTCLAWQGIRPDGSEFDALPSGQGASVYVRFRTPTWPRHGSRRRLTCRRALMVAFIPVPYVVLVGLLQTGRALDHLLFAGFRRPPVGRPVHIVATPRAGTTLLHHLLALDE